jgi:hypothetical protein
VTITDDDLSRWEALASAATPGPWTTDDAPRLQGSVNAGLHQVAAAMGQAAMHDHRADTAEVQRANAAFIAAARAAVPDLCAEVRRLRQEVADVHGASLHNASTAVRVTDERDALRVDLAAQREEAIAFNVKAAQEINEARAQRDASRVEASELRACLADAVGKIEVMRAENGRLRALVRNLEQCVVWNDSTQRYELYQRVAGLLEQAREVKP